MTQYVHNENDVIALYAVNGKKLYKIKNYREQIRWQILSYCKIKTVKNNTCQKEISQDLDRVLLPFRELLALRLVIRRRSRKLGEPCRRGIDGDRDRELLRLLELLDDELCDLERDRERLCDRERDTDRLRDLDRLLVDEELRLRRPEL